MWGCLKWMGCSTIGFFVLLALIVIGGWWYLGIVELRRPGAAAHREDARGAPRPQRRYRLRADRARHARAASSSTDLRIANSPGAVHPYFATAKQVIVTGGIDSFWGRKIRVGRVDIVEPHLYFEVYPAGAKLDAQLPALAIGTASRATRSITSTSATLYVTRGAFDFLDRRHNITAAATDITSTINVTLDRGSVRRRDRPARSSR